MRTIHVCVLGFMYQTSCLTRYTSPDSCIESITLHPDPAHLNPYPAFDPKSAFDLACPIPRLCLSYLPL